MSFLNPLYNALGYLLAFFYTLVPNLGVSIIFATIATMIAMYPLTAKQAKSMIIMQRVQPEVKKLQAKYKGDRQKLNEEVMKFYQENKINPLAGCLPLLVQLPIFYVLFRVLRSPWEHVPKTGKFDSLYNAMCGHAMSMHKPCNSATVVHLTFIHGLIDLQLTPTSKTLDFASAIPYYVLVLLVVLTGYLQTKQATSRTPAASKQMGTVMKIMPLFFGLIALTFPAGLSVYFLVSNLWRLGQQEIIFRKMGTATSPAGGGAGKLGIGKSSALDVASTERENEAKAKAAADAARDGPAQPDAAAEVEPAAEPPPEPKPSRARVTKPSPAPTPSTPPKSRARSARVPQPRATSGRPALHEAGGGGLRSYFRLPPPPTGNGGGRAQTPGRARSTGTLGKPKSPPSAGRTSPSPPQPRRPRKKRKR